jgi:hypothetical protein
MVLIGVANLVIVDDVLMCLIDEMFFNQNKKTNL